MNRTTPLLATGFAAGLAGVLWLHPAGSPRALASQPSGGSAGPRTRPAGGAAQPAASPPVHPPTGPATVRGPIEPYTYGVLAVSVSVDGPRILAVQVPVLQTLDPLSQSIARQALPVLEREVVRAQGSNIQGVSGASYTSVGFYRSLQGALHKLGR